MKRGATKKNSRSSADDVPPLSKRQLAKLRPVKPDRKGKTQLPNIHPGEVLLKDFLEPMGSARTH